MASVEFKLGGILLLKGTSDEDCETLLKVRAGVKLGMIIQRDWLLSFSQLHKLMGGTNIIQRDDVPTVFVPPTLSYIFVSEMPVSKIEMERRAFHAWGELV